MASRSAIYRPAKRFKSCKFRVQCSSTSGKKRQIGLPLKVLSRKAEADFSKACTKEIIDSTNYEQCSTSEVTNDRDQKTQHERRREKQYYSWESIRESLLNGRVEEEAFFPEEMCCECKIKKVEVRCWECGLNQHFCIACANNIHREKNYFHVMEKLKDGNLVPYFPNHAVLGKRHQQSCSSVYTRDVVCIDQYARQHQKQILFCNCEEEAVTLVRLNLWPGSAVRPLVAFHIKLMELAETLLLECHVSLRKFCDALGIMTENSTLPKWIKNIYSMLSSDSFDEFRYQQYQLRSGFPVAKEGNGPMCPLCPKKNEAGTIIESMDACFGLVRKKSAGKSSLPPRHSQTLFSDQLEVDDFVENYSASAKKGEADCNEFKAGEITSMIRSKGKNKLYDEKGVFGRVCRHDYPKGFINIKHGERIAYSVYEIQRMLANAGEDNQIKITYDIACTLATHLKKNSRQDLLNRVEFAIPIFHCYGHKSSCQIEFSPRRQSGYGLTDGEGIERLWSYLRGFSSLTKEMNAGRRIDILTDALLHYGARQIQQFGQTLQVKLKRCPTLISTTLVQLEELFSKLSIPYDGDIVEIWKEEEKKKIQDRNSKGTEPLTWEQRYVENLLCLCRLRAQIAHTAEDDHSQLNDVVKKTKKVLKSVKQIEKQQKLARRWRTGETKFKAAALSLETRRKESVLETTYSCAVERMFLISLKNKYADGQAIAIKLSKQITVKTNKIKAAVTKYNASLNALEDLVQDLPEEMQFDEAKDPQSQLYSHLHHEPTSDNIPFAIKRSAIDLHQFLQRCKEEQELLIQEVERLFKHFITRKEKLNAYVAGHSGQQPKAVAGAICIARKELVEINNTLCALYSKLSEYLTHERLDILPINERKVEAEHALFKSITTDVETMLGSELVETELEEEPELLDFSDNDSDSDHED